MLMFICATTLVPTTSQATHLSGVDLVYEHLGGLRYRVVLRVYRDCSGVNLNTTDHLAVSIGECGGDLNLPGSTLTLFRRDTQDIFCAAYNPRFKCSFNVDPANPQRPSNFEIVSYMATVQLPSRQSNWCFSWQSTQRPELNNRRASLEAIYTYAMLDNLNFSGNNSPAFTNFSTPMPYVLAGKPYTHTFDAMDYDRDSISYELDDIYSGCRTALGYDSTHTFIYVDSLRLGAPVNVLVQTRRKSKDFPIPSYITRRNLATGGYTAVPFFLFNSRSGSVTFIPRIYNTITEPRDGSNKYMVAVLIKDWKRDNAGVMRMRGLTRREVLITVIHSAVPFVWSPPTIQTNNSSFVETSISMDSNLVFIRAQACQRTVASIKLQPVEVDGVLQKLTIEGLTQAGVLPIDSAIGSIKVWNNNSGVPTLELNLNPRADMAGKHISIPVRCEMGFCPLKDIRVYTLEIDLAKDNLIGAAPSGTSLASTVNSQISQRSYFKDSVCLGDAIALQALVVRPQEPNSTIIYAWQPAPGLERIIDNHTAVLRPTVHTMYTFTATPNGILGCADTGKAEVLVKQLPPAPVLVKDSTTRMAITTNIQAPHLWYFNGSILPDSTANIIVPRNHGVYTARVIANGCTSALGTAAIYVKPASTDVPEVGIWPNPSSGALELSYSTGKLIQVDIVDLLGRSVMPKAAVRNNQMNLTALADGCYLMLIRTTTGTATKKLIVQR